MANTACDLKADGSAKDPRAFQQGIKDDASKLELLQEDSEVLDVLLGDDLQALQELLRATYKVCLTVP